MKASTRVILIKRLWGLLPVVVLVLLIMILGGAVGSKKKAVEEAKLAAMQKVEELTNVVTYPLKPAAIADRLDLPGAVTAMKDVRLASLVRGAVEGIPVVEGKQVRKGDLLITLDSRDYQLAVDAASARAKASAASRIRIEDLYAKELATRDQLDAVTAEDDALQAALAAAKLDLERCRIVAPFDGVVSAILVDPGMIVYPADAVVDLVDISRVKVAVGIPESDIDRVRNLKKFNVTIDALGGERFAATRHSLASKADSAAHLYKLELVIDNPARRILPDMFARVEIVKESIADALVIPLYSVISRGDDHHAYVVKDGVVEQRQLKLGLQEGWTIEAREGLAAGDEVVVVGQRGLSNGQKVQVVRQVTSLQDVLR